MDACTTLRFRPMNIRMNSTSSPESAPWHAETIAKVIERLGTNQESGLKPDEVSERLKKHGPNRLPTAGKRGPLMRVFMQIKHVLIYCLLAPPVGKVLLGEWLDASVILGVVIINALLGFIQEGKAEKALDSIRNMLSAEAMAVRAGETRMLAGAELV